MTWRDLAAAARWKAVRSRVWLMLLPVCLCFAAGAVLVNGLGFRLMGATLAVYLGTAPLWGPTMATWLQARRRTWPGHATRWRPTDDGLAIETGDRRSTLPWSTVGDASSWRRGVCVTSGRAVAFIPDRAFSGADHRQEFFAAVQAFMASSR